MTEPTMLALRPCPFCGGEAEIVNIDEGENAGGSCVACTFCQASSNVEFGFKENFISNWNRRALPAEPPTEWIEAMRAEFLKSLETVSAVDLSEEETGEVKLYGGCTPATNYVTIDINDALEAAYAALARQMGGGDAE